MLLRLDTVQRQSWTRVATLVLLIFTLSWCGACTGQTIEAPAQPAQGPGGREYVHAAVRMSSYLDGGERYWLFEPMQPQPAQAPLVVFVHGFGQMNPKAYGAWIEHLVRRGAVVMYPKYQADFTTDAKQFVPNTITALQHARNVLQQPGRVRTDMSRWALIGHSAGGIISASVAAVAQENQLPPPRALLAVQPGRSSLFPLADQSKVVASTLVVALVGDMDRIVRDDDARRIIGQTTQVPAQNKRLILQVSDSHGRPPMWASHIAPIAFARDYDIQRIDHFAADGSLRQAGNPQALTLHAPWEHKPDSTDYWVFWRIADRLLELAFSPRPADLTTLDEMLTLPAWSDGQPIRPMRMLDANRLDEDR